MSDSSDSDFTRRRVRRKRNSTPNSYAPRIQAGSSPTQPERRINILPASQSAKDVPLMQLDELHRTIAVATPYTQHSHQPAKPVSQPKPSIGLPGKITFATTDYQTFRPQNDPSPSTLKGLSSRAVHRAANKNTVWKSDVAISDQFKAALVRSDYKTGLKSAWLPCSTTHPTIGKFYRRASFFPFSNLFPRYLNHFVLVSMAELRLLRIVGGRLQHISTMLDKSATLINEPPPKRPVHEDFIAVAWTFDFWSREQGQSDESQGSPLLLAAGACGVVKVYSMPDLIFVRALVGHGGPIHDICVSPSEPWMIVTASHDRTLRIWDLTIEEQPCVAILGGRGGHPKEVLSCAWHPSRRLVASGGLDKSVKIWAIPDVVLQKGSLHSKRNHVDGEVTFREPPNKSTRAIHVNDPITTANTVHSDHVEQIEWMDDIRLLTKARYGRMYRDYGMKAGNMTEVVLWHSKVVKEMMTSTLPPAVDRNGLYADLSHEGSYVRDKRFLIPRQGFWGKSMAFNYSDTVAVAFQGGVWECNIIQSPSSCGRAGKFANLPDAQQPFKAPSTAKAAQWETLSPAPPEWAGKAAYCAAYAPDGQHMVTCGEDGLLVLWCRPDEEADTRMIA